MIFRGTATALITPFTKDDKVDVKALCEIVERQIASGVDALVALGTTGEPATLSEEEKKQVVEVCIKQTRGRVPVIVGAGSNSTRHAIETCRMAQNLGADGLLVVTPYYNKCTQEGLVEHYGAIADSTSLPIICYNVSSRTGVNMLPETFAKIATRKNVVGIKEASGNMEQIEKCLALCPGKVISGDDALTLPIMAMGGLGVISVASNVCPKYVSDMTHYALDGEWERARKMQLALLPLISALFCEVNPIPIKKAMEIKGYCTSKLRLPLTSLTQNNAEKLAKILADF